jgi:two-component system chemotaxis response regulator CheY
MSQSNTRILLVDDFEMVRTMLKNVLTNMGFKDFQEAENGQEAMNQITKAKEEGRPFDIIFCDWNMPIMTGIEVLETIRKHPDFKNLIFVMVTAEVEQQSVIRALKSGANDYIFKPVAPDTLAKKIDRLLKTSEQKAG